MNDGADRRLPGEALELFAVPADEFIRRRDLLAKELNNQGRAGEAGSVKALRKPTLGV